VRTDIDHLDKTLLVISYFPYSYIGRTALLEVTVVACAGKLAIVRPIPAHRPLSLKL
jgi:hypothetical protein